MLSATLSHLSSPHSATGFYLLQTGNGHTTETLPAGILVIRASLPVCLSFPLPSTK